MKIPKRKLRSEVGLLNTLQAAEVRAGGRGLQHAQEEPQVPLGAALVPGRERGLPDDLLPGAHQALLHTARPRPRLLRRAGLSARSV